jgi:type IV pilus assembly protein PilB
MASEREVLMARARETGYAFVDLDRITIDDDAIATVKAEIAHEHRFMPVKRQDNTLYLVMSNPNDLHALDEASVASGCRIIPVLATREAIEQSLHRYYPAKTEGS